MILIIHHRRAGGVIIKGYGNRIVVDNTLDQRLKLLEQEVGPILPVVRIHVSDSLVH